MIREKHKHHARQLWKRRKAHHSILNEKWKESFASVLPITLIVLVLCFLWVPAPVSAMLGFLVGAVLLVVGMGLFTLGTDLAMTPIGEHVGSAMTRSKKLWLIMLISFLVGVIVTISEPDLQVLAEQVPAVPNMTLVLAVAVGVGLFLVVALLRILLRVPMKWLLLGCYAIVFALAAFVPDSFLAVAFDSGGVTTGPMTVPFILALGVGVSSIRSDANAENDSFGLVALCSVGPILAVMLLGLIFRPDGASHSTTSAIADAADTRAMADMFLHAFSHYLAEVAVALLPIAAFFAVFQLTVLHLNGRTVFRIIAGLLYTYIGLVMFLTGVNVGFMPMGNYLGQALGGMDVRWLLVPIGMVIGYYVVSAEPAVHVLSKQVYELTAGAMGGTVLHAKGTNPFGENRFFGMSIADEKEMIMILAAANQKSAIMRAVMDKAGVHSPAHTVMFTLPVESVAGLRSVMIAAGEIEEE